MAVGGGAPQAGEAGWGRLHKGLQNLFKSVDGFSRAWQFHRPRTPATGDNVELFRS